MPIYTYQCQQCGSDLELRQSFNDPPLTVCSSCGGSLRRVLHPVGIVFKGSGFYNTDYKRSSISSNGESSKNGSSADSGAKESKGSESGAAASASSSSASSSSSKSD